MSKIKIKRVMGDNISVGDNNLINNISNSATPEIQNVTMSFYSICPNANNCHDFDLKDLGIERWRGFDIALVDSEGVHGGASIVTPTTTKDYDDEFLKKLRNINPVYRVCEFLDYHLNYFNSNHIESNEIFLKHIQYVIVPLISKHNESLKQLIFEWVEKNNDMILRQQLEQKNEFLKKAYEIACEHAPSKPLSCNLIPIEVGMALGFDSSTIRRIVNELVHDGFVTTTLGLKGLMIKPSGLNYLSLIDDEYIEVGSHHNKVEMEEKKKVLSKDVLDSIFHADENGCLTIEENDYIEYKVIFDKNSNEAKAKYSKEIAALCNNRGGYLIFGVEDKTKKLIGLQNFTHPGNAHLSEVVNNYFSPSIILDSIIYTKDQMTFFVIYVSKRKSDPSICMKTYNTILKESDLYYRYSGQSKVINAVDKILLYNSLKNSVSIKESEIRIKGEKEKYRPKLESHSHCRTFQSEISIGIKNTGERAIIHEVIIKNEDVKFYIQTPFVLDRFMTPVDARVLKGHTKGIATNCRFEIEFIYEDAIGIFYKHRVPYNGAGGNFTINQPSEINYVPSRTN